MSDPNPIHLHKTFSVYGPGNVGFLDDGESDAGEGSSMSTLRSLVKPFVIKQWLYQGKIYREKKERIPSRFELFFDLVFVAIAHQLSEVAAEHSGGPGLALFILTFFPTWALWNEARTFINYSGTDDILQRVCILILMALLIGYTANASAISIGASDTTSSEVTTTTTGEHAARAVEPALEEATSTSGRQDKAIVAATAFYLVSKVMRVIFHLMYAYALPRFRSALYFQCINQVIAFALYFPLLFVTSTTAIIVLASLGMAFEIFMRYTVGLQRMVSAFRHQENHDLETAKDNNEAEKVAEGHVGEDAPAVAAKQQSATGAAYIPALNIEHFLERMAAFVVIVLGEMVLSIVYHASSSQIGIQSIFGNAICGLLIAFNFCWLYFDAECSHRFIHALRRHWFSGLTFTNLHIPLCASLILASAAMSRMTQHEDLVTPAIRWYFGGGLGCAMLSMAAIGFTHRELEPTGTTRLGRRVQLAFRLAVGVILACLPLAESLTPLEMLGTCAGLTAFLVVEEVYGKLLRGEAITKPDAAQEDVAVAHRLREEEIVEVDTDRDGYGNPNKTEENKGK